MALRPQSRDGLLAIATCVVLLGGSLLLGVDGGVFLDPIPAALGCLCTLGTELVFLRVPKLTQRLWERRPVQLGSALAVILGGAVAISFGATWVVAAVVWGLIAYLGLLAIVVALGRNPLARFVS